MRNLKFILSSGIAGFLISLIFGFFSHSRFIRIFLVALLFGVIFTVLAAIISFLYDKFLKVEGGLDSDGPGTGSSSKTSGAGGVVDLVIQDQDLEQTGNTNHYDVSGNHQMLNSTDIQAETAPVEEPSQASFVPLRTAEDYKNISGTESVTAASASFSSAGSGDSNLDVLPDMGALAMDSGVSSSQSSEDSVVGIEDESSFVRSIGSVRDKEPIAEVQDAALLAKAISSVLSDE